MITELYDERDLEAAERRVHQSVLWLCIAGIALLGGYIAGLILRVKPAVYACGALLALAAVFLVTWRLLPAQRYRAFLRELGQGRTHEMAGEVVAIAEGPELQDGVRVLPVRILLFREPRDERIVYLNDDKRGKFPGPGASVRLRLFGRHVASCEVVDAEGQSGVE